MSSLNYSSFFSDDECWNILSLAHSVRTKVASSVGTCIINSRNYAVTDLSRGRGRSRDAARVVTLAFPRAWVRALSTLRMYDWAIYLNYLHKWNCCRCNACPLVDAIPQLGNVTVAPSLPPPLTCIPVPLCPPHCLIQRTEGIANSHRSDGYV